MERPEVIFSVGELNEYVSLLLDGDAMLSNVAVRGEISGFKRHSSGHLYFSLKDKESLVRCVMFRTNAWSLTFRPEDGQQVVVYGSASLYKKDGSFQLYADAMERLGEGELYLRYLELKQELEKEGFFDETHKKSIPFLPEHVGVVTSGTGAAIQDIISVIGRRFPKMNITLCPVKVQGAGAAEEIAAGIRRMDRCSGCDVLIVGRGGGSMEDLWCFNERIVAEAVYGCRIPVISAVGHETDYTIIDFVADLRAPTPSAAAELAVPEADALRSRIAELTEKLSMLPGTELEKRRERIGYLIRSAGFLQARMAVANERRRLWELTDAMSNAEKQSHADIRSRFDKLSVLLRSLSPQAAMSRGYAVIKNSDGHALSSVGALVLGNRILIQMKDGTAEAVVEKQYIEEENDG